MPLVTSADPAAYVPARSGELRRWGSAGRWDGAKFPEESRGGHRACDNAVPGAGSPLGGPSGSLVASGSRWAGSCLARDCVCVPTAFFHHGVARRTTGEFQAAADARRAMQNNLTQNLCPPPDRV